MAFSVSLWAHFSWNRSYCDSCPLPVRITSPGTRSSSRADSSPRQRLFLRSLQCYCIDYLGGCGCVFALFSVNKGERSSFVQDFFFPGAFSPPVYFLWFLQWFRMFTKLRVTFSSRCWSILVLDLLVRGVHTSSLRKAKAWLHCCTLISVYSGRNSERRRLGKEERGPRGAENKSTRIIKKKKKRSKTYRQQLLA